MFTLPKLPYSFDALEPHIDAQTMEIHYTKHHQAYLNNLNKALESHPDLQTQTPEQLLSDPQSLPESVRTAVINHGGGFYNHSLFWTIMSPDGGGQPKGELAQGINQAFNNFSEFQNRFTNLAATLFGSGWAWLVVDQNHKLQVLALPNQNSPLSQGLTPLMGLDVWEHAYYLKYQNRRADYIKAWWNVVNWDQVSKNFNQATR